MATVIGKIEEFDSSHEDWPQYMERLGYFFDANGIESAEKKGTVTTHTYWSNHVQTPAWSNHVQTPA